MSSSPAKSLVTLSLYRRALRISKLFKDTQVGKRFALNCKDVIKMYAEPDRCQTLEQYGTTQRIALDVLIEKEMTTMDTFEKILKWDLTRTHNHTPLAYFESRFQDHDGNKLNKF